MMSKVPVFQLNDGNKIPQIGLGTWKSSKGEVSNAVYFAIKIGYRHIDSAYCYQNESEVGEGIRRAINERLVKREDLFVTSKCWLTYLRKDRVAKCLKKSLEQLKLDYVDLYLIHWPMAFKQCDDTNFPQSNGILEMDESVDLLETWRAFEELKGANLVKSIGVSNFNEEQIERILVSCSIRPAVHQTEFHPYLKQDRMFEYCRSKSIAVVTYCPLGSTPLTSNISRSSNLTTKSPRLINEPIVYEIAKKYRKSPAQVLIRYHIEKDLIVIPKSTNEQRIRENIDVMDIFKLDKEDMNRLESLNRSYRFCSFDLQGLKEHKEYPYKNEF